MNMQFNPITTQLDMVGEGGGVEPTAYSYTSDSSLREVKIHTSGEPSPAILQVYFEHVPGLPLATVSVTGTIGAVKRLARRGSTRINLFDADNIPRSGGGKTGFPIFVRANVNYMADLSSHSIIGYMVMSSESDSASVSATLTLEGEALPDGTEIWTAPQMVRMAKREAQ